MNAPNDAKIYDQGYRPFTGTLASPRSRFLIITANEFRQALKEKWFKRLALASFIPLVVLCVLVVVKARFGALTGELGDVWIQFWQIQLFFAMLVVYFVGRKAVGEDLRTGALSVYFSRPVSFTQYLLGKWLAIALGVIAVTLVPGVVLAVFKWLAEPHSGTLDFLTWLWILVLLTGLTCLTMGAVMLAVSSLTQRGRAAGIVWIIMFFVLSGVAEGLEHATGVPWFTPVSYIRSSERFAEFLFEGRWSVLEGLSFAAGQLIWIAAGFAVVLFRLRRWRKV